MAGLDVFHHPLRFGMIFDGFTAYGFKVVDLFNLPLFGLGVVASPPFVVFRAFAFRLVFGGNPNPDADRFACAFFIASSASI